MRLCLVLLLLVPSILCEATSTVELATSTVPGGSGDSTSVNPSSALTDASSVAPGGSTVAPSGSSSPVPGASTAVPPVVSSAAPIQVSTGATGAPGTSGPTGSTKSVDVSNGLSVTLGARNVLRDALTLSNTIASLTQQINQLSGELDPSALTAQLQLMAANATAMNTELASLQQQIQTLNSTEVLMESNTASIQTQFSCFAASSCVTDTPPTVSTVTTSPYCNSEAMSTSDTINYQTFSSQSTSLNCTNVITAGNATVELVVTTTIAGNAFLNVLDGQTLAVIQSFTKSVDNKPVSTGKSIVDIAYGVLDSSSSISFTVQYKAKAVDCSLNCGEGTCKLDSNGVQFCDCTNPCAPPDVNGKCTAPTVCSRTQTRQCGSGTTCTIDTSKQTCYTCKPNSFDWHSITKYFGL